MKGLYKGLAYVIAVEVAIQAAAVALALFGLGKWIEGGGVLDKALLEAEEPPPFIEGIGFLIHGMNGMYLIPLLALVLLIVSFFARVPGGVAWAALVLLAVVVQVLLGLFARGLPALGALHGLNALLLFSLAVNAAHRVRRATTETTHSQGAYVGA